MLSVEATPLDTLPGTSGNVDKFQKCCDKGRTSKCQPNSSCVRTSPAVDSPNSSEVEDGPSCFSSRKVSTLDGIHVKHTWVVWKV